MRIALSAFLAALLCALSAGASAAEDPAADPEALLARIDDHFYLDRVELEAATPVRDYLIALGAVQKIRGVWAPRDSERVSGLRLRYTWRVVDGYSSTEVVDSIVAELEDIDSTEVLFSCDARACGSSVQWANRIFSERLLYGVEKSQRYRVYRLRDGESEYRVLLYGSARSSDRQYLRAELLELGEPD